MSKEPSAGAVKYLALQQDALLENEFAPCKLVIGHRLLRLQHSSLLFWRHSEYRNSSQL